MAKHERGLMVEELTRDLQQSEALILGGFRNIPAVKMNELRNALGKRGTRYLVVKNSICRLALKRCNLEAITGLVEGPTCVSLLQGEDIAGTAKILVDFAKANETFTLQGGYVEGEVCSLELIKELASLPSREVLVGQVTGGIKTPLVRLVLVLGETLRKLNAVLGAVKDKKSGGERNG